MAKPTKSRVTNYEQYSVFSGSPAECSHHLIYGRFGAWREFSEKWGLKIPLLNREHNMSSKGNVYQIHNNPAAESLSKICGQLAYERIYLAEKLASGEKLGHQSAEDWLNEAREDFRKQIGESFL